MSSAQEEYCRADAKATFETWKRPQKLPKSLWWHLTHWGRWSFGGGAHCLLEIVLDKSGQPSHDDGC